MEPIPTSFEFALPENLLPQRLQSYRLKKKFTDITIKVGEEKFAAHKIVLEDSSPMLKAWLSENWSTKNDVCEFSEEFIDPDVVEDLLSFFYTSKVTLTTENAHSICVAAHFLNVPTLLNGSERFLSERVSSSSVLDLFLLSDKLELETLRKSCVECFFENYEIVLKDPKLISFSYENLQMIIRELNKEEGDLKFKEILFETLISWVEHDLSARTSSLPSLLKSVPLQDLSQRFLSEVVATKNIIGSSFPCSKLVLEALSKVSLNTQQPSKALNKLYCFGGINENKNYLSSVSNLNISTGKWNILAPMPNAKAFFAGTVVESKVYLFGGSIENGTILNTAEVFDCAANTWTQLQAMTQARYSCAAVAFEGFIYVSGGMNSSGNPLNNVDRYNIETNEWQPVKAMLVTHHTHQLVESNGLIYAVGGNLSNNEEYNPTTDVWKKIANTKYSHSNLGAASSNGKIYVLSNTGFEMYSPESNTWKTLTPLHDYTGRTLLTIKGKLYALGGGKDQATKSMFEFDTATERWRQLPDMDVARKHHCSFFINP